MHHFLNSLDALPPNKLIVELQTALKAGQAEWMMANLLR